MSIRYSLSVLCAYLVFSVIIFNRKVYKEGTEHTENLTVLLLMQAFLERHHLIAH